MRYEAESTTSASMHTKSNPMKSKPSVAIETKVMLYSTCVHYTLVFLLRTGDEEFDELCFEFGIELDEVVSEK